MQFTKGCSILLVEFEARWQAIGIQELQKTIEQRVIHFGYPMIYLVSHISQSIRRMGSGNNFTTHISEWPHFGNVKQAYRSTTKAKYIQHMLKHNDLCTGLDYMEEILSYLALQGWYNIDPAKVFNLLLAADKWQNTRQAHLLRIHHCQKEQLFCPISQQGHHLRGSYVRGVCRSMTLTSPRDGSVDFGIPNFEQLFRTQIEDDWGHEVSGLVLGYDHNVLIYSVLIKLQNGLLYSSQPFHCPHLLSIWNLIAR